MNVVCIDNSKLNRKKLTVDKVYRVLNTSSNSKDLQFYIIRDDTGLTQAYQKSRFIPQDEYRENKLNELLNKKGVN